MKKNSLIWKINHKENNHESFLLGTMHVKDARAFTRWDDMLHCIDNTQIFATEFNLEEAELQAGVNSMDLPPNLTLSKLLGEKKYKKIKKIIYKSFQIDISFFNNSLPILVQNILTEKVLFEDQQQALDHALSAYAKQNNKVMLGVETFQDQLDILSKIPINYQLKQLKDTVKNISNFRAEIKYLADLYQEENIRKLYKSTKKSAGKLRNLMLYDRNFKMADKMGDLMLENSCTFAVGAAHLWGEKGIIKLIKDKGFRIKPLLKTQNDLV